MTSPRAADSTPARSTPGNPTSEKSPGAGGPNESNTASQEDGAGAGSPIGAGAKHAGPRGLVPLDRNSGDRWERYGHDFPYPVFDTERNREVLSPRHVFRFPNYFVFLPEVRARLGVTYAKARDPASISRMSSQAKGRLTPDQEERYDIAGRLAALLGKEAGSEKSSMAAWQGETMLKRVWADAEAIVESLCQFRESYAGLQVKRNQLIRREEGEGPAAYLGRVEERFREVLEDYYTARSSLQKADDNAARHDAQIVYPDITRPTIPEVRLQSRRVRMKYRVTAG